MTDLAIRRLAAKVGVARSCLTLDERLRVDASYHDSMHALGYRVDVFGNILGDIDEHDHVALSVLTRLLGIDPEAS